MARQCRSVGALVDLCRAWIHLQAFGTGADSVVLLYDILSYSFVRTLLGHTGGINDIAWSPDSRCLVSASDDRSICMWSAESVSGTAIQSSPYITSLAPAADAGGIICLVRRANL
jgi:WD40 repeat protein